MGKEAAVGYEPFLAPGLSEIPNHAAAGRCPKNAMIREMHPAEEVDAR